MSVRLSNKEMARAGTGGSKYRAVRQLCSAGHNHDSKRESARCDELRFIEAAGTIRELKTHVKFDLIVNDLKVCAYEADFTYHEKLARGWKLIVEDCKGMRTPVYRLKKKLMDACLSIVIRET